MRVRIIDAFTDRPFAGNPAGVCLLDGDWPADARLLAIATELGLPMTAFARPAPGGARDDWELRWFMPSGEEPICGHATLAAAHALRSEGRLGAEVRFATLAGMLTARPGEDGALTFDFPAAPVEPADAPPGLAVALGAEPSAVFATGPLRDRIALYENEAAVRALHPDMAALAAVTLREDIRGVTATAPADPGAKHDFVSRFFSPADGMPEDAVTGSAHTALAPYWCARLGRDTVTGLQASARTGVVRCALRGDRVDLTGDAVTVLEGEITA